MLIPPIGSAGAFQALTPFNTTVNGTTHYECKAVRRFIDIIHEGVDPFAEYYVPAGLSQSKYDEDYKLGACIVSLVSTAGTWVHVPTTYIESYPNVGGIPYTAVVLGINLGAIPDMLDLTAVKAAIVEIVHDYIGVTSSVMAVKTSITQNLSYNDHTSIEAARQAEVTATVTERARRIAAQAQVATLQQQLTALQNYIRDHLPP
jgi:hypothetical protein